MTWDPPVGGIDYRNDSDVRRHWRATHRCAAAYQVGVGDSGGAVLVRGIPAGVTSRSFGGWLGFTPLVEGLTQLGLDLCTTPDCGLEPPTGVVQ